MWKIIQLVAAVGIRTHNLLIISLLTKPPELPT